MKDTKWYTILALILAIWFVLTSWLWVWVLNLFISFPIGLVALILYFVGRRQSPGSRLNKIVLILLIAGFCSSVITIFLFTRLSNMF